MRHGGTDMLAVACIVGGGVIAGGVTLALASGPSAVPSLECAAYVGPDANVVANLGQEGVVVVRPDVRVREVRECMSTEAKADVKVETRVITRSAAARGEVDRVRREVEQARREADRVREEIERARDRVRRSADLTDEERKELIALELREVERDRERHVRVEVARPGARDARDRARIERDIAWRVRDGARGERDRARLERDAARIERDAARLERELAGEARERAAEMRERVQDIRGLESLERARAAELRARVESGVSPALPSVSRLRLRDGDDATVEGDAERVVVQTTGSLAEGLHIQLPDRSFRIAFRGLEGLDELERLSALEELDGAEIDLAELQETLTLQLDVLENLDVAVEGLDEDIAEQVEQAVEREMRTVQLLLERLKKEIGG